jgi:beta-lactam-binding protein with PASTA domain
MLKLIKHVVIIGVSFVAIVLITFYALDAYTGDESDNVLVPDIVGVRIDKAKDSLQLADLEYLIIDSVYSERFRKMTVTEQDPAAGSSVKKGRKIYLIINSLSKPMVKMPKLVNSSFNLAKVLLKNNGLKLGEVTEKTSDLGEGFVLKQFYKSDTIAPNTMIEKGARIDLWVSKKTSDLDSASLRMELEGNTIP